MRRIPFHFGDRETDDLAVKCRFWSFHSQKEKNGQREGQDEEDGEESLSKALASCAPSFFSQLSHLESILSDPWRFLNIIDHKKEKGGPSKKGRPGMKLSD